MSESLEWLKENRSTLEYIISKDELKEKNLSDKAFLRYPIRLILEFNQNYDIIKSLDCVLCFPRSRTDISSAIIVWYEQFKHLYNILELNQQILLNFTGCMVEFSGVSIHIDNKLNTEIFNNVIVTFGVKDIDVLL